MPETAMNMLQILNIPGLRIWLCLKICQSSVYTRVLNMTGFSTYQGSEYLRVVNIPQFPICLGSESTRVTQAS